MKKLLYILLFNILFANIHSQSLSWARGFGGNGQDEGRSVTTDAAGNVYTTGFYEGTVDFDPGAGVFNLTAAGKKDIFVSKLDPLGNFQWARTFGDTADDRGNAIRSDASGNVYLTGYFTQTVDFDPGAGTSTLVAGDRGDIFILKLDNSGNLAWAKNIGGVTSYSPGANNPDQGSSLALDATGNVYISGRFLGTADFDPGASVFNMTATWGAGMFVLKLDALGNFVWSSSVVCPNANGGTIQAFSIGVDTAQNVYTTGSIIGNYDFDPGPGTYTINTNWNAETYVCKFDASGGLVWAKEIVGNFIFGYSLMLDPLANVFVTGFFSSQADFDPGQGTYALSTNGNSAIFVLKLDAAGNFVWARQMGDGVQGNDAGGFSLALDSFGDLYVGGSFSGNVDFDPGQSLYNLASVGNSDVFISKLSASGNFISAISMGGPGLDRANSIAIDGLGNILMTGVYSLTCDFDPSPAVSNLTAVGDNDVFVVKLTSCILEINSQPANQNIPVGSTAQFTVASSATSSAFQWQQNSGNGFADLSNNAQYTGVNTSTLSISNVILAQNNYTFRCIATSTTCVSLSNPAVLTVFLATGVNETNNGNYFTISPNPASDLISLKITNEIVGQSYSVQDQTGRQIMRGKLEGKQTLIELQGLSAGLYFISVDENKPVKIIKE